METALTKSLKHLSLILIVLSINLWAISDNPHYRFRNISQEDGLSNGSVYAIMQDSRGFMWFGTRHGLNRWDGRTMRVYNRGSAGNTGLPSSRISALAETPDGYLWVGTYDGGLARFDPITEQFKIYDHDITSSNSIPDNNVTVVYADSDGILWIGTQAGLGRYDQPPLFGPLLKLGFSGLSCI